MPLLHLNWVITLFPQEERFLFPIFPLFSLCAAITLQLLSVSENPKVRVVRMGIFSWCFRFTQDRLFSHKESNNHKSLRNLAFVLLPWFPIWCLVFLIAHVQYQKGRGIIQHVYGVGAGTSNNTSQDVHKCIIFAALCPVRWKQVCVFICNTIVAT